MFILKVHYRLYSELSHYACCQCQVCETLSENRLLEFFNAERTKQESIQSCSITFSMVFMNTRTFGNSRTIIIWQAYNTAHLTCLSTKNYIDFCMCVWFKFFFNAFFYSARVVKSERGLEQQLRWTMRR